MSHLHRTNGRSPLAELGDEPQRSPFSGVAGRFASWITGADRLPPDEADLELEPDHDPLEGLGAELDEPGRFPLARVGYERAAVDEHLRGLERELAQLRAEHRTPLSINEELERLGEQTASILVVAHDKAQETTRRAQEQADRCVADAAANAVEITAKAKERLRQLDSETDAVWRERERLLDDVRVVSLALATLADDASARFPAAETPDRDAAADGEPQPATTRAASGSPPAGLLEAPADAGPRESQDTVSFAVAEDQEPAPDQPGDTGSWLAGLQPE